MMTNPTGRITQGQFSFLPDLSDDEIALQIEYGLDKGYAWSVEYTDDPHPRNTYWEMYGMPMFDLQDAGGRADGAERLPQDLSAPLHPHDGLRLDAQHRDDRDELHRQPAGRRARLRASSARRSRPLDALHGRAATRRDRPEGAALRRLIGAASMSRSDVRDPRQRARPVEAGHAAAPTAAAQPTGSPRRAPSPRCWRRARSRRCSTNSTAT